MRITTDVCFKMYSLLQYFSHGFAKMLIFKFSVLCSFWIKLVKQRELIYLYFREFLDLKYNNWKRDGQEYETMLFAMLSVALSSQLNLVSFGTLYVFLATLGYRMTLQDSEREKGLLTNSRYCMKLEYGW